MIRFRILDFGFWIENSRQKPAREQGWKNKKIYGRK